VVAGRSPLRQGCVLRLRAPGARDVLVGDALTERRPLGGGTGEYILDWDDVRTSPDPRGLALEFARSAFRHACAVCEWDPTLAATAEGTPPPVS